MTSCNSVVDFLFEPTVTKEYVWIFFIYSGHDGYAEYILQMKKKLKFRKIMEWMNSFFLVQYYHEQFE